MDIKELTDWKDNARHKEVAHWKGKYERTVRLCKLVYTDYHLIGIIKRCLRLERYPDASELWNELDTPVQKLLITAPRFGGPFTTAEVKQIKELWEVSIEDIEK